MQSRSRHLSRHGFRALFNRYGVVVSLATVIALLAALGGSWGTAFGQTAPQLQPTPAAQVAPTPAPTVQVSGVSGAAPAALPATGQAPVSNELPVTLAIAGVVALGAGFTAIRMSTRKQ